MPAVMPHAPITSRRRFPRFILVVLGLIMVVSGIYGVIFKSSIFAVESVEVEGVAVPAVSAYAEKLYGRNIFQLRSAAIEQDVRQAYPPVKTATLVRGLPRKIRIVVTLRQPALRWQVRDHVYLLDSQGEVFEVGDKPEYAQLPKIVDKSPISVQVGQRLASPSFVTFVTEMQQRIPDQFKRAHVATEVSETLFHLDVVLEGDFRIRLTTQRPLDEQIRAAHLIASAHPDAKLIDVRIPKWGYYK